MKPQTDYLKRLREQRNLPMMEIRPFLLPYLVQLGVVESYAKTFTVRKAYDVLYRLLSKRIKVKIGSRLTKLWWLWTNGVHIDALGGFTEKQATQLLKQIWANKRKKTA